ncbi:MAG: MarR family transcriptional regulator [bacterium]
MKHKEIEQMRNDIVSVAGLLFSRFSLSPIAGEVYALLYLSAAPVSLNDMVRELKISKGSASMNIRALETWGAVRKVWVNSDRKDYYEADPDILNIALKRFKEGISKRMNEISPKISEIDKKIQALKKKDISGEIQFYGRRFQEIKHIHSLAEDVIRNIPDKFSAKKLALLKKLLQLA